MSGLGTVFAVIGMFFIFGAVFLIALGSSFVGLVVMLIGILLIIAGPLLFRSPLGGFRSQNFSQAGNSGSGSMSMQQNPFSSPYTNISTSQRQSLNMNAFSGSRKRSGGNSILVLLLGIIFVAVGIAYGSFSSIILGIILLYGGVKLLMNPMQLNIQIRPQKSVDDQDGFDDDATSNVVQQNPLYWQNPYTRSAYTRGGANAMPGISQAGSLSMIAGVVVVFIFLIGLFVLGSSTSKGSLQSTTYYFTTTYYTSTIPASYNTTTSPTSIITTTSSSNAAINFVPASIQTPNPQPQIGSWGPWANNVNANDNFLFADNATGAAYTESEGMASYWDVNMTYGIDRLFTTSGANTSTLAFNYDISSLTSASSVTNAAVYVYNYANKKLLAHKSLASGGTSDTGWQHFSATINTSGVQDVEVIIRTGNEWSAYYAQTAKFNNFYLTQAQN